MPFRWSPREHFLLAVHLVKWVALAIPLGAVVGSAVAGFLVSLEWATTTRWNHPWLLYLLPASGAVIGLLYHRLGQSVEAGNNLIIDEIHKPGGGVPARMAPLVLIGTVLTHLFGGSAGREGTAVQMGGSIASTAARVARLSRADTRALLVSGIAAGFGSVFGTPLTGAIFAVEVLAIGLVSYEGIVPALVASAVADRACAAWGVHHTVYPAPDLVGAGIHWALAGKVAIAAVAFGFAGVLFAELAHSLQRVFRSVLPSPILRPMLGGLLIIALVYLVGADYIGLGVTADPHHPNQVSILSSFRLGGASYWSWWWKILFTAVTLSSGFKGGEVTPLFFIGAALGNAMARILGVPEHVGLFAVLGFVSVFAGATNTPLACTLMGIELFASGREGVLSSGLGVYLAIACFIAYLTSGHSGIYLSQRIGTPKMPDTDLPKIASLRTIRDGRR